MHPLDKRGRIEGICFPRAGAAAAHIDRHDGGRVGHDDGNAGARPLIMGVANPHTRHIAETNLHATAYSRDSTPPCNPAE